VREELFERRDGRIGWIEKKSERVRVNFLKEGLVGEGEK
jgi:hypothetical protein